MDTAISSTKTLTLENTGVLSRPPGHRNGRGRPAHPARGGDACVSASAARVKERGYRLAAILWATDLVIACIGIGAGLGLRAWQRGEGPAFLADLRNWSSPEFLWMAVGGVLFSMLMLAFKSYETSNLYRMHVWAMNAGKALVLWLVVTLAVVGLFYTWEYAPRAGLFYAAATLGVTLTAWRLLAFVFLMQPRVREASSHRIVIVGWNEKAGLLRQALRHDTSQLSEIVGCVPAPVGQFAVRPPGDLAVLGEYSDLARLAQEFSATCVILADVSCPPHELEALIGLCQRELLDFQMVPGFFPALGTGLQIRLVSGVPLLGVSRLPLERLGNRIIKRTIDIVGAVVGLVVSLPIMAVFATLVYLESRGPVLYRQSRTSRNGRSFFIYKIRSMRPDAEAQTGVVWAKSEDPRELKIGRFMRRWDIDELPQFWNVLRGDMSLVGPRPERPELIARFKEEIPNYNVRHEVRAGLTGWAQIHGLRGDTDLRKRIEYDLYYLENWNPALDLQCVLATLFRRRWAK